MLSGWATGCQAGGGPCLEQMVHFKQGHHEHGRRNISRWQPRQKKQNAKDVRLVCMYCVFSTPHMQRCTMCAYTVLHIHHYGMGATLPLYVHTNKGPQRQCVYAHYMKALWIEHMISLHKR